MQAAVLILVHLVGLFLTLLQVLMATYQIPLFFFSICSLLEDWCSYLHRHVLTQFINVQLFHSQCLFFEHFKYSSWTFSNSVGSVRMCLKCLVAWSAIFLSWEDLIEWLIQRSQCFWYNASILNTLHFEMDFFGVRRDSNQHPARETEKVIIRCCVLCWECILTWNFTVLRQGSQTEYSIWVVTDEH